MPESVRNRCTKAHEYIFLFTKQASGYYYDAERIREKTDTVTLWGNENSDDYYKRSVARKRGGIISDPRKGTIKKILPEEGSRNKRSVWKVATQAYSGAHFATFPEKLITPYIQAGTSEKGACIECGAPWIRVVERDRQATRPGETSKVNAFRISERYIEGQSKLNGKDVGNRDLERHITTTKTIGWEPQCDCEAETTPCLVLDPFIGSGTTAKVAIESNAACWVIELNEEYIKNNIIPRVRGCILDIPSLSWLVTNKPKKIIGGEKL